MYGVFSLFQCKVILCKNSQKNEIIFFNSLVNPIVFVKPSVWTHNQLIRRFGIVPAGLTGSAGLIPDVQV